MSYSQQEKQSKEILWKPHPKQAFALARREFEILYGGSRGGGKTDAGIVWLIYDVDNPKLRALILRRNSDDLKDWVDRAEKLYSQLGAVKVGNPPEFKWPSGAIFRTGHLNDDSAYTKYQGHEYQRMLIEELTQIPNETAYLNLLGSARSTIPELRPQVFLTTNPGELGHLWVKERFVDIGEPMRPHHFDYKTSDGRTVRLSRIYVPATMDDNPTLIENDPAYIARIEQIKLKDQDKYLAWRFGHWDVFKGQVYGEFRRDLHTCTSVIPRLNFPHFLWIDWGYSGRETDEGAFAAYAAVLIRGDYQGETFNRVIVYREWFGKFKYPAEWAEIIYKDAVTKFNEGVGDSAMFNRQTDGSKPIAHLMEDEWDKLARRHWLSLKPGTKNRIGRVATLHNWLSIAPDGLPYLLIMENCNYLIKTIPALVYDKYKVEDVNSSSDDHGFDALTYGLSAVKFIPAKIGGIQKIQPQKKYLPEMISELDLEAFEKAGRERSRDWKSAL